MRERSSSDIHGWILTKPCLLFDGPKVRGGYGKCCVHGERRAHRASYKEFVGDIPKGMYVCHRCDVRNCIEPSHLFLGTQADNMADMVLKGRSKTCGGHYK